MLTRGGGGSNSVHDEQQAHRGQHDLGVGQLLARDLVQKAHKREVDRRVEARRNVDEVGPRAVEPGGHAESTGGLYAYMQTATTQKKYNIFLFSSNIFIYNTSKKES